MRVLIIGSREKGLPELESKLEQAGYEVAVLLTSAVSLAAIRSRPPDATILSLVDMDMDRRAPSRVITLLRDGCDAPVIGIVAERDLTDFPSTLGLDDFAVQSVGTAELSARIQQAQWRKSTRDSNDVIKRGDLVVDLRGYEVTVAGRVVPLTFREYELLKFLASDPGRVFGRELLMNKVWGYDYQGGDRAVDVVVRRLRSKIEDRGHTFIETVRNVGYRFREAP